ncbi:MAG: CPBP family intramembrane metalloprotease [Acidobacteria bacterium]|nr:CPBP family intramembrane metalloprotease [Acidobacteriota bacterium]
MTSPWRAARAAALAEVVLTSGYPTQVSIGLLLVWAGMDPRVPDGRLSMPFVVTLWLVDSVVLVGLIVALLRLRGERLGALLFGTRSWLREAGLGLALVPVVFGLVIGMLAVVRYFWPGLHNVAVNPFEDLIGSGRDAAILAAVAVLSGGIKEELQRAFVLRRFERYLGGARVGLVVFSVAFGAGHFIQGWDVGVVTTLLGLFWGILFLKRGSFTASAVSHSGFNVAQIIQFVVVGS